MKIDLKQLLNTSVKDLTLPDLPYEYDALEPHISKKIMELHHDKHHAGYLKKLQGGLSGKDEENKNLHELFSNLNSLDESTAKVVMNHGGGYYNHALFWNILSPKAMLEPSNNLLDTINLTFGSYEEFKNAFATTAASVFGSGWTWLVKKQDGTLAITKTQNQNNNLMSTENEKGTPLLGIDLWEHSYYLDYYNDRDMYINAWWNVLDWEAI